MYSKFLSAEWLMAVRQLLMDVESDGLSKRIYDDEERFKMLIKLHSESLVDVLEYSISKDEVSRRSQRYLMALAFGYNRVEAMDRFTKKYNNLLKEVKRAINSFTPKERESSVASLGYSIIQSITIKVSPTQKSNLDKKMDDYLDAFINNKLIEPGKKVVAFENHKFAFVEHVEDLSKNQSVDNMLVEEMYFKFEGWYFWEMAFALEKIGFIEVIELGDNAVRSRIAGQRYVRVKLLDPLKIYYQEVVLGNKPQEKEIINIVENKVERQEDFMLLGSLKLDRNSGEFINGNQKGKLTPQQKKLMLILEKFTSKDNQISTSTLMAKLGHRSRAKGAFKTLISKTRASLDDREKKIICSSDNFETKEVCFYLNIGG